MKNRGKGRLLQIVRVIPFLLLTVLLPAQTSNDAAARAMRDELQRSLKKLQLESLQSPYFISYRIVDTKSQAVSATFGSLTNSSDHHGRALSVAVRVGDYALDNTNFLSMPFGNTGVARMFGGTVQLPLDDNYDELRRQLWLATDGAYKKALEDFSGKKALLENRNRVDNVPDFTKGSPVTLVDNQPTIQLDQPEAEKLARRLSNVFRDLAALQMSSVHISAENVAEHFISSEGADITRTSALLTFRAQAETQAEDGSSMSDSYRVFCRSLQQLPDEAALTREIRAMAGRLIQRRTATRVEQYNGPVLFEGQAAAELFARDFASHLPVEPSLQSDNPQFAQAVRSETPGTALLNKLGARVMPGFISVVDNPTAASDGAQPLMGSYQVDEEGTPAHETKVVENGILKTLLTSRVPVRGVLQSTGNFRGRVAPSNLIVNSSKSVSPEELKQQLIEMVKSRGLAYGVVVRSYLNNFLVSAYRVYPDGHEDLLRKGSVSGFNLATFKELAAVSNRRTVYSEPFNASAVPFSFNSLPMPVMVSYVVPDLLFEDISLQGPTGANSKPPVVPPPT